MPRARQIPDRCCRRAAGPPAPIQALSRRFLPGHAGVRNRGVDRRPEFHELARARPGGHPRLFAAATRADDRAVEPPHRHSARGGAPLPVHARQARLRRHRGRQDLRAAAANPCAGSRLPVVDSAGDCGAAAARSDQRRIARVELDGGAGRRRNPLHRALIDDDSPDVDRSRAWAAACPPTARRWAACCSPTCPGSSSTSIFRASS